MFLDHTINIKAKKSSEGGDVPQVPMRPRCSVAQEQFCDLAT